MTHPHALCHFAGSLTGEDAANELLQAEINAEGAQRLSAATIHTDASGWLRAALASAGEAAAAAAAQPGTVAAQQDVPAGGGSAGDLPIGELQDQFLRGWEFWGQGGIGGAEGGGGEPHEQHATCMPTAPTPEPMFCPQVKLADFGLNGITLYESLDRSANLQQFRVAFM